MDLNLLKIFKTVAETESFTKAALKLKKPKSRISRAITSLEKELGLELIMRTTRQSKLTAEGLELFKSIAPLLNEMEDSLKTVGEKQNGVKGSIRITLPEDIAAEILGPLCHEFMKLHPEVEIALQSTKDIIDLVKDSMDLAIRVGKIKDSSMIQTNLGHIHMVLVASRDCKLKSIDDLAGKPFLHFSENELGKKTIELMSGKKTKLVDVNAIFASNNFFVLRSMCVQGTGIALLPKFLAQASIKKGELIQLLPEWKAPGMPIQILVPKQRKLLKKTRAFIDFVAPRMRPYFID